MLCHVLVCSIDDPAESGDVIVLWSIVWDRYACIHFLFRDNALMLHYENETNNITYWKPFHLYVITYNLIYRFINNFLHAHISCISGWRYNANSK